MSDRDKLKPKTPPVGVRAQIASPVTASPESWDEPITGNYTGPELEAMRKKRPTDQRIGRLETKADNLEIKVDALTTAVANIDGKLEVVPRLVSLLETVVGSKVAGDNAKLTATLEIGKATATDQLEENKERRARWSKTWTQILAGAGIAATAVLAAIQARGC